LVTPPVTSTSLCSFFPSVYTVTVQAPAGTSVNEKPDVAADPIEAVALEGIGVRLAGGNRDVERRRARLLVADPYVVQRIVAVAEFHRIAGAHQQQLRTEGQSRLIHHRLLVRRRKGARAPRLEHDHRGAGAVHAPRDATGGPTRRHRGGRSRRGRDRWWRRRRFRTGARHHAGREQDDARHAPALALALS
jgi:hypothetical protein